MIRKIIDWWNSVAGKHPMFTYDKFAHGWLHTMIVVFLMDYGFLGLFNITSIMWYHALLFSVYFGIAYELLTSKDLKDSLMDIVWNTIGGLIGVLI